MWVVQLHDYNFTFANLPTQPNHPHQMGTMSSKNQPVSALIKVTDYEEQAAAFLEPGDDESDWVVVDEPEWTDEELMDDGRPGRRATAKKSKGE
jgi:hypothetical protein